MILGILGFGLWTRTLDSVLVVVDVNVDEMTHSMVERTDGQITNAKKIFFYHHIQSKDDKTNNPSLEVKMGLKSS